MRSRNRLENLVEDTFGPWNRVLSPVGNGERGNLKRFPAASSGTLTTSSNLSWDYVVAIESESAEYLDKSAPSSAPKNLKRGMKSAGEDSGNASCRAVQDWLSRDKTSYTLHLRSAAFTDPAWGWVLERGAFR